MTRGRRGQQRGHQRTRRLVPIVALLAAFALLVTPTVATAAPAEQPRSVAAADEYNTYAVTGLPQYLTAPVTFTVDVTGPQAVCGMDYGPQEDTAAPWTFTVTPDDSWGQNYVEITLCDGTSDYVNAETTVPYEVSKDLFTAGERDKTVRITNVMDVPAVATVTDSRGRTIAQAAIPPGGEAEVTLPRRSVARTTTYQLTIQGDNGVTTARPVVIAKGWAPLGGPTLAATRVYTPCSTVGWYYDDRREPGNAQRMPKDIVLALGVLAKKTNLSFTRVNDPDKAQLQFSWRNLGSNGPSALGGYSSSNGTSMGSVEFNTKDWWTTDRYAGIGASHTSPADRGWLVVHEVMHSMGLGHVDNPRAIMSPINRGQHQFTRGDLEGLRTLYPKQACAS